jgi:hypothetical protein
VFPRTKYLYELFRLRRVDVVFHSVAKLRIAIELQQLHRQLAFSHAQ